MSFLEIWAEPRYKPIASLAQTVALCTGACHELLGASRKGKFLSLPEAAGITEGVWCSLYRHPTPVRTAVFHAVQSPETVDDLTQACIAWKLERRQFHEELREQLRKVFEKGCSEEERLVILGETERVYHEEHVPMLRQMIADNEPVPENARRWFGVPEFNFFLTVGMPCWLEYQTTPHHLYRRAQSGDFEALEALLRLDSSSGNCKGIPKVMFDIQKENPALHALLNRARWEGRKQPITLADVKFLLGAWLMEQSQQWQRILNGELHIEILKRITAQEKQPQLCHWIKQVREKARREPIKCRLKAPDIRRLFDALARDTGVGLVDPDFSQLPNSIFKRLTSNQLRFNKLAKADKRRAA